jgi:hypothetical protein
MKEKIGIYYNTSESFNYFYEIFTIQFFNSMYVVVLTTAYKLDPTRFLANELEIFARLQSGTELEIFIEWAKV